MADVVGAGLSDEKEAENDDKRGEKCSWDAGDMGEINAKDMTETLGFYERHAARKEKHDAPGEFVCGLSWLNHHHLLLTVDPPTWLYSGVMRVVVRFRVFCKCPYNVNCMNIVDGFNPFSTRR